MAVWQNRHHILRICGDLSQGLEEFNLVRMEWVMFKSWPHIKPAVFP